MARLNGILCDWCGHTQDLKGDLSRPSGWAQLILRLNATNIDVDICEACADQVRGALRKVEKFRKTGKRQR